MKLIEAFITTVLAIVAVYEFYQILESAAEAGVARILILGLIVVALVVWLLSRKKKK